MQKITPYLALVTLVFSTQTQAQLIPQVVEPQSIILKFNDGKVSGTGSIILHQSEPVQASIGFSPVPISQKYLKSENSNIHDTYIIELGTITNTEFKIEESNVGPATFPYRTLCNFASTFLAEKRSNLDEYRCFSQDTKSSLGGLFGYSLVRDAITLDRSTGKVIVSGQFADHPELKKYLGLFQKLASTPTSDYNQLIEKIEIFAGSGYAQFSRMTLRSDPKLFVYFVNEPSFQVKDKDGKVLFEEDYAPASRIYVSKKENEDPKIYLELRVKERQLLEIKDGEELPKTFEEVMNTIPDGAQLIVKSRWTILTAGDSTVETPWINPEETPFVSLQR